MYLAVFAVRGDSYQLWKFAAMTALPLTFLQPALLVLCLARLTRLGGVPLVALGTGILAGVPLCAWALAPVPGEGGSPSLPWHSFPVIAEVAGLQGAEGAPERDGRDGRVPERVVFDFMSASINMAALLISEGGAAREVLAVKGGYFIPSNDYIFLLFSEGTSFYTDRDYQGPYGADFASPSGGFRIRRWDLGDLGRDGVVAWEGVSRSDGALVSPEASLAVSPPAWLAGRDIVLEVTVPVQDGLGDPRCHAVVANVSWTAGKDMLLDVRDIRIPVPGVAFAEGPALVRLAFPGYAMKDPGGPEAARNVRSLGNGPAPGGPMCGYAFERAEIRAADGEGLTGSSHRDGGAGGLEAAGGGDAAGEGEASRDSGAAGGSGAAG
jgi:hypothetical protein